MSFGGIYQFKRRRAMEDELQRLAESTCAFVLRDDVSAWSCGEGVDGHPLFFEAPRDDDEPLLLFLRERCWGDADYYTVPFDAGEAREEETAGYQLFGRRSSLYY